jgi:hypothetical protein
MDLRIVAVNLAASDKPETVIMSHPFGIYTMSSGERLNGAVDADHTQAATAVHLDSLLAPAGRLPFALNSAAIPIGPFDGIGPIKIDVEEHEPAVLRGGLEIICEYRPVVICESWTVDADRAIDSVLRPEGYVINRIGGERNLLAVPNEQYPDWAASYQTWKDARASSLDIRAEAIHSLTTSNLLEAGIA